MISFGNVTKRYPDGTVAVDSLELTIDEQQLTVFVGPSGCGKTTSMRMINRMIEPTSGTISVAGRDVSTVDPVSLRLGIGYVIQSGGLLPHRTVLDNVATVPVLKGRSRRQARSDAAGVLERVGLDPALGSRYPAQLSGGQQQRVGVARALAADPPILLMDEPFSAVDPVVREDLQREMQRLQAELKKTIVFVTHDIDEAITLGDRIAVFGTGGRLQQYDTPEAVLSSPATEFVAEFVGRDRGYRGLSFRPGDDLPVHDVPLSTIADLGPHSCGEHSWLLLVTDEFRPAGWITRTGLADHVSGRPITDIVVSGGSLYTRGADLRQALDAAISSPAGLGVTVDGDGRVVGAVHAHEVIDLLDRQRAREDP